MSKNESTNATKYGIESALIPTNIVNATLAYLQERPYKEVQDLIAAIKQDAIVVTPEVTPSVVQFIQTGKIELKR